MSGRPIARLVVCLAILILGTVSALRLEIAYLPNWSFPEIGVQLRLPQESEVDELTRIYVQPLEAAIRAVGSVTSTAGTVDTSGARFTVRFRPGTDPERKAARLESELAALRRQLPPRSRLDVWPAGRNGGDMSIFLWIEQSPEKTSGRAVVAAVEALSEVRGVEVAGRELRELRLTSNGKAEAAGLGRAIDDHLAVQRLGEASFGGRRLPVLLRGDSGIPFGALPVRQGTRLLPLASLADMRLAADDEPLVVHRQGKRGLVLVIHREHEASPLALERALHGTLERFDLEGRYFFIRSEATPLAQLLERLALGFLVATLVTTLAAGLLGGWRAAASQALVLPVALAAALVAFQLAGISLDVTTLPMLAVALGWCLFFPAFRLGGQATTAAVVAAACAALLPIAVALAGGRLTSLFQAPTRAFLCALLAAIASLAVVPLPHVRDRLLGLSARKWLEPKRVGRPLRAALRNPWTVLLGTLASTYALFVVFGSALEPRPMDLSPVTADLRVALRFPPGTTPKQAESQVALAERELSKRQEIVEHWSWFNVNVAFIDAGVRREDRSAVGLRRLSQRLDVVLGSLGSSARVTPLASGAGNDGEPVRFDDSLEDRAETDAEATFYRFVLRSTDLEVLKTAHAQIFKRATAVPRVTEGAIRSGWGNPGVRLELVPRPGADPADVAGAVEAIRRRALRPSFRELASESEVRLRVLDVESPNAPDDVRQRIDLLGLQRQPPALGSTSAGIETLAPGALLQVREIVSSPSVRRQSGRYVLPVTVRFFSILKRWGDRQTLDRVLRWYPVPAGCDLELPDLNADFFTPDRRRMLAIASTLPLLLWALASTRLDSAWRGLVALAPLVVGVAAATPWIRAAKGHVDEMTIFVLGAMAVGGAPLAMETLAAARSRRGRQDHRGQDYRWLVSHLLAFLVAMLGMVLLLVVPGLGVDADRHPWAMPMRLAAVAGAFTCLASLFCLPGLLRSGAHWRERKVRRARRRATLEAWRSEGRLELEVRRLNKVYRNGFQALAGVDFHLEPGIIGLLGPNGAGKTTLLRTLCGLLEPTRGQVCYRGIPITPENLPEYRRLVGFLPQDFNAYAGFTGARFLDYWALEKGIRDPRERGREVERWLAQVGLEDAAGRKVRDYSGGMRRRIGIARALIGDPPIVIVDEPTTGLDVASRNRLRESLLQVAGERIILFSTHIASDVAAAAARILLLHGGRLLYDGSAKGLIESARGSVFETVVSDAELRDFSHRYRVTTRVRTLDGIRVRAVASEEGEPPGQVVEPNLEEAYLTRIGGQGWRQEGSRIGPSLLDLDSWRKVA